MHIALPAGSAFHLLTELYDQGVPVEGLAPFPNAFDSELEERGLPVEEYEWSKRRGEDYDWWCTKGQELFDNYVNWRLANPDWVLESIEEEFEIEVAGIQFRGAVDRIFRMKTTGKLVLVDMKTGYKIWESSQLEEYAEVQSRLGKPVDFTGYYDARLGQVLPLNVVKPYPLDDKVTEVWDDIQAGKFPPNKGSHCRPKTGWCPQRFNCPVNKEKLK